MGSQFWPTPNAVHRDRPNPQEVGSCCLLNAVLVVPTVNNGTTTTVDNASNTIKYPGNHSRLGQVRAMMANAFAHGQYGIRGQDRATLVQEFRPRELQHEKKSQYRRLAKAFVARC